MKLRLQQIFERLLDKATYDPPVRRRCKYKETQNSDPCSSKLFTLHREEIAQSNLCDVHFWKSQALSYRDALEVVAHDIQLILPRILAKHEAEQEKLHEQEITNLRSFSHRVRRG